MAATENGTGKVKLLSVEDILSSPDIEEEIVEVPEWGGAVRIRGMSRARLDQLRKMSMIRGALNEDRFSSYLFRECMVEPQLTEEQYKAMREKPAGPIARLEARMMALVGLSDKEVENAEAMFPQESGS